MKKHALLSASGSHRWLNCTPSARLEENVPDKGSEYAEEGTLAHAFCAKELKTFLGQPTNEEDREIEMLRERYLTDSMPGYVEAYVNIVLEKLSQARQTTPDAVLIVEQRLDFSKYVPEGFGTADAVIVADNTLDVVDFKYGKGIEVSAHNNSQMKIYALGALEAFRAEYSIKKVRMSIIQPRVGNYDTDELSVEELERWGENELKEGAQLAAAGVGVLQSGDWCQFCKVKNRCKKLAVDSLNIFERVKDPRLLTPEEFAKILPDLPTIEKWAKSAREFAQEQALDGVTFPGYKLVAGRSVRKITDDKKAFALLTEAGFCADAILKPSELKGLGDLEGIVGKKKLPEILGDLLVKPEGKPTLVEESDKRPALNSAGEDFKQINN